MVPSPATSRRLTSNADKRLQPAAAVQRHSPLVPKSPTMSPADDSSTCWGTSVVKYCQPPPSVQRHSPLTGVPGAKAATTAPPSSTSISLGAVGADSSRQPPV